MRLALWDFLTELAFQKEERVKRHALIGLYLIETNLYSSDLIFEWSEIQDQKVR